MNTYVYVAVWTCFWDNNENTGQSIEWVHSCLLFRSWNLIPVTLLWPKLLGWVQCFVFFFPCTISLLYGMPLSKWQISIKPTLLFVYLYCLTCHSITALPSHPPLFFLSATVTPFSRCICHFLRPCSFIIYSGLDVTLKRAHCWRWIKFRETFFLKALPKLRFTALPVCSHWA